MNERIKELMIKHGIHKNITEDCQHRIEMLAELIIRECIEISQLGSISESKLKKHFGVEE